MRGVLRQCPRVPSVSEHILRRVTTQHRGGGRLYGDDSWGGRAMVNTRLAKRSVTHTLGTRPWAGVGDVYPPTEPIWVDARCRTWSRKGASLSVLVNDAQYGAALPSLHLRALVHRLLSRLACAWKTYNVSGSPDAVLAATRSRSVSGSACRRKHHPIWNLQRTHAANE